MELSLYFQVKEEKIQNGARNQRFQPSMELFPEWEFSIEPRNQRFQPAIALFQLNGSEKSQ